MLAHEVCFGGRQKNKLVCKIYIVIYLNVIIATFNDSLHWTKSVMQCPEHSLFMLHELPNSDAQERPQLHAYTYTRHPNCRQAEDIQKSGSSHRNSAPSTQNFPCPINCNQKQYLFGYWKISIFGRHAETSIKVASVESTFTVQSSCSKHHFTKRSVSKEPLADITSYIFSYSSYFTEN